MHSSAITTIGRIYTWGFNANGQLGNGTTSNKSLPTDITDRFNLEYEEKTSKVKLGFNNSSVITSMGRLYIWGDNDFGQLGDGTKNDKFIPTLSLFNIVNIKKTALPISDAILNLSLGYNFSLALTSTGKLLAWGDNYYGLIGDGKGTNVLVPTEITNQFNLDNQEKISKLFVGLSHSSVITSKDRVFTWGFNSSGQLGDGTVVNNLVIAEITNQFNLDVDEDITKLSLGLSHSSAISSKGRVFTWGYNGNGQLGDGTTTNRYVPTDITNQFNLEDNEKVDEISLGYSRSSAITSKGRVFTWGDNDDDLFKDGPATNKLVPNDITSKFSLTQNEKITGIFLRATHSSAITSTGRIFTWGNNNYGQLGDGTTTERTVPTDITNQFNLDSKEKINKISLGAYNSSAITSTGRVFTWGGNNYSQLGDGTAIASTVPIDITNQFDLKAGEVINALSLGNYHSSAITSMGRVFTWGDNFNGQLGDGTRTAKTEPTQINKIASDLNQVLLTYTEEEQNYSQDSIKISIFFEYDFVNLIKTIEVNNQSFEKSLFSLNIGRIDLNIPSSKTLGETINLTINSITLLNDEVIIPKGYTSTSITLIGDTFKPEIIYDYKEELVIEEGLGYDLLLNAKAIDDTGESLDVLITGSVDWSKAGTYELIYTATDSYGNETIRNRVINIMPNISTSEDIYNDMTFYHFDDEVYYNNPILDNQFINFNNKNYYSDTVIDNSKLILGNNDVIFKFEFENKFIIVSKQITVPLIGIEQESYSNKEVKVEFIGEGIYKLNKGEAITINSGHIFKVAGEVEIQVTLNLAVHTYNFIMVDTLSPTFSEIEDQTLETDTSFDWLSLIKNESDNYDGPLTKRIVEDLIDYKKPGNYTVKVAVADSSGNETIKTINVIVMDSKTPNISLKPALTTLFVGEEFDDPGLNIADISKPTVNKTGEVDTTKPGKYTITYIVEDEFKNLTRIVRVVNVLAKEYNADFELVDAITTIKVGDSLGDLVCNVTINGETFKANVKNNDIDLSKAGISFITYSYTYNKTEYSYRFYIFIYDEEVRDLVVFYKKDEEVGG